MKQITTYFIWLNNDLFTRKSIITEFRLNIFKVIQRHYKGRETFSKIVLWPHSSLCKLLYHRAPRLMSSWSVQKSVPRFFCCMTRCQKSRAWYLQPAFLFEACLQALNCQKIATYSNSLKEDYILCPENIKVMSRVGIYALGSCNVQVHFWPYL